MKYGDDRKQHQNANPEPTPGGSFLSQFNPAIRVATVTWAAR